MHVSARELLQRLLGAAEAIDLMERMEALEAKLAQYVADKGRS